MAYKLTYIVDGEECYATPSNFNGALNAIGTAAFIADEDSSLEICLDGKVMLRLQSIYNKWRDLTE